jgi:hypothetical protein
MENLDQRYVRQMAVRSEFAVCRFGWIAEFTARPSSNDERTERHYLHGLGIRCIQEFLKMVNELGDMQPVGERMVHMDRYRHGAATACIGNLAKRYPWCRIGF